MSLCSNTTKKKSLRQTLRPSSQTKIWVSQKKNPNETKTPTSRSTRTMPQTPTAISSAAKLSPEKGEIKASKPEIAGVLMQQGL
ncbi:hypothetical protein BDU57DRAFT_107619 [Ampelomyces quisqualis]|uniref:Uncharacterized protein n=1 Tax=Ampelomyces quisqualis TaxID=50730 RepID=A0A6A5Q5L0_AMPQU|nr:hypothetical protein BDU57DRAFT_107619 [Ampelomyces quisqualis]